MNVIEWFKITNINKARIKTFIKFLSLRSWRYFWKIFNTKMNKKILRKREVLKIRKEVKGEFLLWNRVVWE